MKWAKMVKYKSPELDVLRAEEAQRLQAEEEKARRILGLSGTFCRRDDQVIMLKIIAWLGKNSLGFGGSPSREITETPKEEE